MNLRQKNKALKRQIEGLEVLLNTFRPNVIRPVCDKVIKVNEDKIADIEALRSRIIDAVHTTICAFFEPVPDDLEAPMTPFEGRLLAVNKAICNRIREVFEVYGREGES